MATTLGLVTANGKGSVKMAQRRKTNGMKNKRKKKLRKIQETKWRDIAVRRRKREEAAGIVDTDWGSLDD